MSCQMFFNIKFQRKLSSSRQLVWSYNLNSQSEILELLQKLKASDYRFDNQTTCCYCFEITKNSDAHFKRSRKWYWKIFKYSKLWKYYVVSFYCQLRCYSYNWKRYCQILPKPQQTWRLNFTVALFISQSHINQVPVSCFCSERKESIDQIYAKNKKE